MSKLICPHCGAATAFLPEMIEGKGILKEHTTNKTTEYGKVSIKAETSRVYGEKSYAILLCMACTKRFVAEAEGFGEEWAVVYPIPHKTVAKEIPEPVKKHFEEAHLCFAVGAHTGCLLMCRTALIALQRKQKVSSLKELRDNGSISPTLYRQADEIRLWGNMMGHEDVPEPVSKEDTEELLTYVEALTDSIYVQPKRLSDIVSKRKQIARRQSQN